MTGTAEQPSRCDWCDLETKGKGELVKRPGGPVFFCPTCADRHRRGDWNQHVNRFLKGRVR